MLLVKTYIEHSPISGFGLFLAEPVKKQQMIWTFNPVLDIKIKIDVLNSLTEIEKNFIKKYAYVSPISGQLILLTDNARFMNHSFTPNVIADYSPLLSVEGIESAKEDLAIGTELTCDYRLLGVSKDDLKKYK